MSLTELKEIDKDAKASKGNGSSKDRIQIDPPNLKTVQLLIVGTAPYVQCKFPQKVLEQLRQQMEAGSTAKSKKKRDKRDFEEDFINAQHISTDGWNGMPASAFRAAMVSACRLTSMAMTLAKLSVFIEAEGFDNTEFSPLIRIYSGKPGDESNQYPVMKMDYVRIGTTVDIRARPCWNEWYAKPNITWDADVFTIHDIVNLMSRVGQQVGIGEGRPDSKKSCGQGWGTFTVESAQGEIE